MGVAETEPREDGVTERAEAQGWVLPSDRTAASSLPLTGQASLAAASLWHSWWLPIPPRPPPRVTLWVPSSQASKVKGERVNVPPSPSPSGQLPGHWAPSGCSLSSAGRLPGSLGSV